jgi:geranylgeranyl pyrophosphate synthase
VLDDSLTRAREYTATAVSALSAFPPSDAKEALTQLAEYVVARQQ